MVLSAGAPAPDFNLPDQDGRLVRLADFAGGWLVLYAYPKDNTPGCTQEAKDFSCLSGEFSRLGARIAGVSPDKTASHRRFMDQQGLDLLLLSDPDHRMLEDYQAWGLKRMMGREYMGVIRSTWLVDPAGRLAAVWSAVKVKDHAREVRETLARLSGARD
ncbi:MAG: peroxiredoxin [bacterium]|jgi:peroxiredoxin Q/BCP|nr:peroxiredoxin [bacterium]